jgi:hypothetical protein
VLNADCSEVIGAAAVLHQVNSSISMKEAASIANSVAAKYGYSVTNVTAGFIPKPEYFNVTANGTTKQIFLNVTSLSPGYRAQTNQSCTIFLIAANGTPSAPTSAC